MTAIRRVAARHGIGSTEEVVSLSSDFGTGVITVSTRDGKTAAFMRSEVDAEARDCPTCGYRE